MGTEGVSVEVALCRAQDREADQDQLKIRDNMGDRPTLRKQNYLGVRIKLKTMMWTATLRGS